MLTATEINAPSLDALLRRDPSFPNMPRIVALVVNEANRHEPDLRKLCQWIGCDPGLAAHALQMANSDKFGLAGKITSVSEALAVLDQAHLRALTTQAAAVGVALPPVRGIDLRAFWRYSLNTAKVARSLAGTLHLDASAAYALGIVHALGELVILDQAAARVAPIQTTAPPLGLSRAKAERRLLDYCHSDVIAGLARKWHWPDSLIDALQHQHDPFGSDNVEPLAGVLHLSAWRASAREAGLVGNELTVTFPGEVGVPLGLDIDVVLQQDPIDWHSRRPEPVWR